MWYSRGHRQAETADPHPPEEAEDAGRPGGGQHRPTDQFQGEPIRHFLPAVLPHVGTLRYSTISSGFFCDHSFHVFEAGQTANVFG